VGKAAALSRARAVAALAATTAVTGCHGSAQSSSPTVALNQQVRDGKFAFRVTRVDVSTPNIGIQTAQGVFVVVDITVQNIGDEPRTVYCQNQKLKDLAGRTYDDAVTVGRGDDLINVEPGKQVRVTCAFDVPKGTLTGAVEVHDRAYSPGATVQVLGLVR
jgi:Domain of unknown function (DUF4352)